MKEILLLLLLMAVISDGEDYECPPRKSSKTIKISAGDSVTFNTNPDGVDT